MKSLHSLYKGQNPQEIITLNDVEFKSSRGMYFCLIPVLTSSFSYVSSTEILLVIPSYREISRCKGLES